MGVNIGSTDHSELVQLTIDYCLAIDSSDFETLRCVFTPDAAGHLGENGQQGVEEIIDWVSRALSPLDEAQHTVSNHQVEINGDTAVMLCYVYARHIKAIASGDELYVVAGRYEDRCVHTDNGWRIAERRIVSLWEQGNRAVFRSRSDGGPSE